MATRAAGPPRVDVVTIAQMDNLDANTFASYELVVSVGLAAAQAAVARADNVTTAPPTLCLLIPRQSFERLQPHGRVSAVFIDQPLPRLLDLLHAALPERNRIGVVLGPTSQRLGSELGALAHERALRVETAQVSESSGVAAALQTLLPKSDLLLLLPDPVAINANTIYGLLLTSYRTQVPVVGYSEGLLNAGALLALYSSARQQGRQGAEIASSVLARNANLPAPQYPKYFTVRINASVARSLGLHLPSEAELSDALNATAAGDATTPQPARDTVALTRGGP
jgi:ABC-type uncharacterized transport system substrate-binding protein